MIAVQPMAEPMEFEQAVRRPGQLFLAAAATPINWKNREYWRRALPALRHAYGSYCAYLAMRIPMTVGNPTVDHFRPKRHFPQLAYEWHNFRLASAQMNAYKGDALDLVDPFQLPPGWFALQIPAMLTKPGAGLEPAERQQVERTIQVLRLNHEDVRQSRKTWVMLFALGKIPFDFLAEEQPFVAQELQRQGLDNMTKLRPMFG